MSPVTMPAQPAAPGSLMSREAAAQHLGVSPRTIDQLIRDRALVATRIGRRVLIDPADLREFLARSKS